MSDRLHVLFLTQRLPYAPNRGDRVRSYHMLRTLAPEADVTVASLVHDAHEAGEVHRLEGLAVRTIVAPTPHLLNKVRAGLTLASSRPLTVTLLDSPALRPALIRLVAEHPPDVVLAYCSSMARFAIESPLDRFPLVIDMVDADSMKWQELAALARWPMSWVYRREARTLSALETDVMERAHATVAVNAREVTYLRKLAPNAQVDALGVGVDFETFAPPGPPVDSQTIVFCGVMNYAPNQAGAHWLARDVWPIVRRSFPAARLRIVGSSPTAGVRALGNEANGIVVTGAVPDVRPELWGAAIATAPLHTARGVQTKVLEAVAAGLPCVITSAVQGGLPIEITPACLVGDTTEAFAAAIVEQLRKTPEQRRARATVDLTGLSWTRRLKPLLPLLREASRAKDRR